MRPHAQAPEDLERLDQLRSDTEGRARANQAALGAALGAQVQGGSEGVGHGGLPCQRAGQVVGVIGGR